MSMSIWHVNGKRAISKERVDKTKRAEEEEAMMLG